MQLSPQQITAMTSDAASLTAGKRLAGREHWRELGQNRAALWGTCRGSADYQVRVDLSSLAHRCTCPSRQFPCKHVLGLLLLAASNPDTIPEDEPPDWVSDWLEKRQARKAGSNEATGPAPKKSVDVKAQQKRQQKRDVNIRAGLERLDLWMKDLVRHGLAGVERKPRSFWEDQAKRLVDAQAPGVAGRIRRLAGLPGSSPDWPLKLLGELGKIKLLIHAYERIVELSAPLQQDVRQLIGWNVSQQELETSGERVEDQWALYGQWVDDDDRLRTQRTWVVGLNTGRTALILQFAPGTQPFAEQIIPGIVQHATLCFYPGALSLRAKFQERLEAVAPITSRMPGYGSVDEFLDAISTSLAWQPWLGAVGCVLHDVTLSIDGECWYACDHKGEALKLSGRGYWECLAVTGGCPCDLMGEWHGDSLRPLGTLHDGHYRAI